jgi:hypothetical protein
VSTCGAYRCPLMLLPTAAHLEHGQLQNLIALLLSSREALIHIAVQEGGVHVEQLELQGQQEEKQSRRFEHTCKRLQAQAASSSSKCTKKRVYTLGITCA